MFSHATRILYSHPTKRHPQRYRIPVSVEDFERVSAHRWTPIQTDDDRRCGRVYFAARVPQPDGRCKRTYLHRFIMNAPRGAIVDFRNSSDTLDNRRSNLRFATWEQDAQNARKKSRNNNGAPPLSRYKGVCLDRDGDRWKVRIQANGKRITIGKFDLDQEIEAARAYDSAALKHHGEFAVTNFTA